jgi:hypothetical protein
MNTCPVDAARNRRPPASHVILLPSFAGDRVFVYLAPRQGGVDAETEEPRDGDPRPGPAGVPAPAWFLPLAGHPRLAAVTWSSRSTRPRQACAPVVTPGATVPIPGFLSDVAKRQRLPLGA